MLRRVLNGLHNIVVAGAAAEVAFQRVPDLRLGRISVSLKQLNRVHDHPGGTEPALKTVLFPESFLDWVQYAVLCKAFDRHNVGAIGLYGKNRARFHRLPIDQDGTRPTLRRIATDVCAG